MRAFLLLLLTAACARHTSMSIPDTGTATGGGAGTATGGSSATGGTTATGGAGGTTTADAAPCPPECLRAVRCVTACGGTPVSVGCCPCTPPAFDDITCPRLGAFESFRHELGAGPCAPNDDCSQFTELQASGLLRVDCYGQVPVVVHEVTLPAAERDAVIATLTDPALVSLLDLGKPPCPPPTDVGETMTLTEGGRKHTNSVTLCQQQPIESARKALEKMVFKYLPGRCPKM
jgi:hypothetical protein